MLNGHIIMKYEGLFHVAKKVVVVAGMTSGRMVA